MNIPKTWDEYEIKARYIPCFLAAIVPIHFGILLLGNPFWDAIAKNVGWMVFTNLSLSLVVTLALIQLQCGIAKHWIEEGIFGKGGINFPSTVILLFQDSFLSKKMKVAIRAKIAKDFNFELMSEIQELADTEEAKRLAREAVGFIRRDVGNGVMTHHYNIRYGFIRNLTGGALWGLAGSVGCAILYGLQNNWHASSLFIGCAIFYISLLLFRKKLLIKFAHQYAEILFNEYMVQRGEKNESYSQTF